MICKIRETINKYDMLRNCDKVIVGFSGGADSSCLIRTMIQLSDEYNFKIIAAHINHCLRGAESDRDEAFVRKMCDELGIELFVLRADISNEARKSGESIEECGRRIRYDFFNSLCDKNSKIATAHNFNDCEETLFLNLIRGSGLKGLCSIPPVRNNIIRPLIECTRNEIEDFCESHSVEYVTDSTNNECQYSRNKIRHKILPVIKEMNPSFDACALRCIQTLREDEKFLDNISNDILTRSRRNDGSFNVKLIRECDSAVKNRILSEIISEKCGDCPEKKHLDILTAILNGGSAQITDGIVCKVKDDVLTFPQKAKTADKFKVSFENCSAKTPYGIVSLELTDNNIIDNTQKINKELALSTFDYDKIIGDLTVRSRDESDKITLCRRNITKSLKKLFNEDKIETELRNKIPIISDENGIVWIYGYGSDKRCAVDKNTKIIATVKYLEEDK